MISLVIPLYNEEKNVEKLVQSILKQTVLPSEVVFVEAGSKDNTLTRLYDFIDLIKDKGIKVNLLKLNHAYPGKARNEGVKESTGDIILFVDAGIDLNENWIKELSYPILQESYQVVWGRCERRPKTLFSKILVGLSYGSNYNIRVIPCMAILKDVFFSLGGFREDLRAIEDTEFIKRLDKGNYKEFFNSNALNYYYDFPEDSKSVFLKWKKYNEFSVYSGVHAKKTIITIVLLMILILSIFNLYTVGLITILYLFYVPLKIYKKQFYDVKKLLMPSKYFIALKVSLAMDIGRTVGIVIGLLKKKRMKTVENES